jgi:hypothetical protein
LTRKEIEKRLVEALYGIPVNVMHALSIPSGVVLGEREDSQRWTSRCIGGEGPDGVFSL